jgi:hypothetical protein
VETLAVNGLWGCTCVAVISQKGAWVAHFWEYPSFVRVRRTRSWTDFEKNVLQALDTGIEGRPRVPYINEYALGELRNKDDKGDLGHMFDDANKPEIFLVAPRRRMNIQGTGEPDTGINAGMGTQAYAPHNLKISLKLKEIFGRDLRDAVSHEVMYSPMVEEGKKDLDWNTARGKFIIQYMPAPRPCKEGDTVKASARIIFENGKTEVPASAGQ